MKRKWEWLRGPAGTAFLGALAAGFACHLFGLTNVMHNHDNVGQVMNLGAGVVSGRWMLEILQWVLTRLGLIYNLPLVNGCVYLLLLGATAAITVEVLEIRQRKWCALVGALFTTFPTVTATMFFRFTAPAYGLSAVLAALAVWVLPRKKWGIFLSAGCIAVSMGIYQAYVPFTIALFLLALIKDAHGGVEMKSVILRGLRDCGALLLGLAVYFVCLKVCLRLFGQQLNDYQGMQSMGKLSLAELPGLILRSYRNFLLLPVEDYCGLASFPLVKVCYGIFWLLTPVLAFGSLKGKTPLAGALAAALLVVFPLGANFIVIMCPQAQIHTLMIYGFVLGPCVPLVLLPETKWVQKGFGVVLAVFIGLNSYYANVNYAALHSATEQMGHYLNSLVTQVRMTPGFDTSKRWAIVGQLWDPQMDFVWRSGITYGGNSMPAWLLNVPTRDTWFRGYLGYELPMVSAGEAAALAQTEQVKAMPVYPNYGSIQIIGDTVVVKFGES